MEIKLDLHVHSHLSPDGRMSPEEIAAAAKKAGLQAVAICDHERVWQGARECDGILLIPGGEFSTEHGHLLGLFLSSPIEKGSFAETAAAIRAQGGIPVLAHPFQKRRADRFGGPGGRTADPFRSDCTVAVFKSCQH